MTGKTPYFWVFSSHTQPDPSLRFTWTLWRFPQCDQFFLQAVLTVSFLQDICAANNQGLFGKFHWLLYHREQSLLGQVTLFRKSHPIVLRIPPSLHCPCKRQNGLWRFYVWRPLLHNTKGVSVMDCEGRGRAPPQSVRKEESHFRTNIAMFI
jgi:hypothetical protein